MINIDLSSLLNDVNDEYCRIIKIQKGMIHYSSVFHKITQEGLLLKREENSISHKDLFKQCLEFITKEEGVNLDNTEMFPDSMPLVSRAMVYYAAHY